MSWNLSPIPILGAPTGSIAGPELCAAVTAAGGMGAMGLTWTEPEVARKYVKEVRANLGDCPSQNFQVNFVLHFEPIGLTAVLEEGAPVITFSWGQPDRHVDLVRSFGARFGVQVVNEEGARHALDLGADFLICQGIEAGGHVQSSTPLIDLLPRILEVAGETPVAAAGGLVEANDISQIRNLGASSAVIGTRFVACQESRAHPTYKKMLVESTETALTLCFGGGWANSLQRVLKNKTFRDWESAGCPQPGSKPGEGDDLGGAILRYEDTAPQRGIEGKIEEMCLYAGTGVGRIADLPSAAELVKRLCPNP